jgi:HEPN domain-containing protein
MFDRAEYWLDLCDDDLITAKWLQSGNRLLHMAYFCHLVCEKALKAAAADASDEMPPKTHDLVKLAKKCSFFGKLTAEQQTFLDEVSQYQIEARYPEHKQKLEKRLNSEYCSNLMQRTEEFLCWIKKQLGK